MSSAVFALMPHPRLVAASCLVAVVVHRHLHQILARLRDAPLADNGVAAD